MGMPALARLRSLVAESLNHHLYTSAAFYADKLVTLSNGAPQDVYLLAQVGAGEEAGARGGAQARASPGSLA